MRPDSQHCERDVTYDKDVTYAGAVSSMRAHVISGCHVIYVEDDINGESRHLCVTGHGCVGNVIYDQHAIYGQKRHVWTARRLRGKPLPGSARVPPWAIVSIAGIAMAQQLRFAAPDTNL
jgi:hypothetical protein